MKSGAFARVQNQLQLDLRFAIWTDLLTCTRAKKVTSYSQPTLSDAIRHLLLDVIRHEMTGTHSGCQNRDD